MLLSLSVCIPWHPIAAQDTRAGTDSSAAPVADSAVAPRWPVSGPTPLPGSILPARRIVAYYGNPLSQRMGILGEIPKAEMLKRLNTEVAAWRSADPNTPVQPALHLVAMVAQEDAGRDGKYRTRMRDTLIERVYGWAKESNAIFFVDLQVGLSTIEAEVPRFEEYLSKPDIHLGLDPEFAMKDGARPGKRVGTLDAAEINWAIAYLAALVDKHNLPPKVLVIHRYTRRMLTNADKITLDPRVQVVIHADGWGAPQLKRDTYNAYVRAEPVQFTGFKVFYKNDTRRGSRLMTPAEILSLTPAPLYIQYQ